MMTLLALFTLLAMIALLALLALLALFALLALLALFALESRLCCLPIGPHSKKIILLYDKYEIIELK